jgi:hypothetical protein
LLQERWEQRQQNRAIKVVEEPLLEKAQALAVEPHVKRQRIERLPAVFTEAAPAEQESAASTAELAVLDAKAKQDAANIQQLWEEDDPMDAQDDVQADGDHNDKEEEWSLSLSDWPLQ